LVGQSVS
jgi:putative transposase